MHPFQRPNSANGVIHTPILNYASTPADQLLHRAIKYANKYEISSLIDDALRAGARLNDPNNYVISALVIAVRANNHHAISPLMARGALIPIPIHSVNLLMEACANGHVDMVIQLIEVAKMDIHAQDIHEKTALHYALIGGSKDVCTLLLGHGANPNAEIHYLSLEESHKIFGLDFPLHDQSVTPLMIAVGKRDEHLTNLLLDAGANPNLGAYSPLVIAACADEQSIFDALLARNAELLSCKDLSGNEGLCAFVAARVPVSYLSELVGHHDFSADNGSLSSPLGLAVRKKMQDACALLLHCEAPVKDHDESDDEDSEEGTIWTEALSEGQFSSPIAMLLTAAKPAKIDADHPIDFEHHLLNITLNIDQPASLASLGFFTSLLWKTTEKLAQLKEQSAWLTRRQQALAAASIIRQCLPPPASNKAAEVTEDMEVHEAWRLKAQKKQYLQRDALSAACDHFIEYCGEKLLAATTLEFFLDSAAHCPDNMSLRRFIAKRIAEESGMPNFIGTMVSNAWNKAAALSQSWALAQPSEQEGNRFLLALMINHLISAATDNPRFDSTKLEFECLNALKSALPPRESLPLHHFCINPVNWLRKFEQRNSLADPANDLTDQLQPALGIPFATCESITTAWTLAIQFARQAPWSTPKELQHTLEVQLAINLNGLFPGEHSKGFVSADDNQYFVNWSSGYLFGSSASSASRKRPAETEAPDTPLAKLPRNSSPEDTDSRQTDE